ncbi:DeoR/GlpR family DNA-binding transcription regulator [Ruficoccus sp. ZRK36]|uniref:DeoR/GlpR family DNA-binding transcription regulator n=1 Tax=Ruficoccus sp. ZRK36 TaxID=2866311 RepID=UPI001C73A397|nr:DeoR/GlpR family DNA-binding transcription regulator [Ruficoccus sp. ZRK36]QYY34902.1 DeoR/GlpR family DNA-binding transcription regulator [Ruficoccus sp. ZRK36]
MLPAQRQEVILRRIEAEGSVKSGQLARDFGVTNETIRKDLEALEDARRVIRIHGGATRLSDSRHDLPLPARQTVNRFEKTVVAKAAASLVGARDTLFLDASSTVLAMTDYLPQEPLTILTNAHHVIVALGGRPGYDLICTGGSYEERSRSYVGVVAEDSLRRFLIKWLFVGVDGLHHEIGASEVNPGQAALKERLIPRAERVCVVCDSSKLETKSPFIFAQPQQVNVLVTDDGADPAILGLYERQGIRVIAAPLAGDARF